MGLPINNVSPVTLDAYNSKSNQILHKTDTVKSQNSKIDKSAKDFESLLLSGWLQQAQQSFASVPGGDTEEDSDPGKGQLQGLAMQSLGTALTASGGLGIANSIAKLLHRASGSPTSVSSQAEIEANLPRQRGV